MVSAHLRQCLEILERATKDCGPVAAMRRDPDTWSAAEVVEHLQRAYLGTAKGFERCIENGAPMAKPATLKQRLQSFVLLELGYFPEGRQAPKHVLPTGALDLSTAVGAARRDLERLDGAAVHARDRFGTRKIMDHPILGAFSVEQWLRFHVAHTRHHEKQILARK